MLRKDLRQHSEAMQSVEFHKEQIGPQEPICVVEYVCHVWL